MLVRKRKEKEQQLSIVQAFDYPENYRSKKEAERDALIEKCDSNEKRLNQLAQEKDKIDGQQIAIRAQERENSDRRNRLVRKKERFDELCIKMNVRYEVAQQISAKEGKLRSLKNEIASIDERISTTNCLIEERKNQQNSASAKKTEYQSVTADTEGETAELISDPYDRLKAQYDACKQKFTDEKKAMEEQLTTCNRTIAKLQIQLESTRISEAEYSTVDYTISAMKRAEAEREEANERWKKAVREESDHKSNCKMWEAKRAETLRMISDMNKEVLPKSEVGAEFDVRCKACKIELDHVSHCISEKSVMIRERKRELDRSEKISSKYQDTESEHHAIEITDNLIEEILNCIEQSEQSLKTEENQALEWIGTNLSAFAERDQILKNVVDQMKGFIKNTSNGDRYYTMHEKLEQDVQTLTKQKARLDTELSDVESSKMELVGNCLQRCIRLYDGLKMLSSRSRVKIFDQYRQMIKIKLPEISSDEVATKTRMTQYIENCVNEYRKNPDHSDAKKRALSAHKYMSLRRLLNRYIGHDDIPVDVYKIGNSAQTSAYRKWETALKANSGGEKFVVFFALVLSMMNYSRSIEQSVGELGGVLILDNPFGPISSTHLLTPMFEIAKKFRIQLICFTHLATADIVKCFSNSYNLKLKARPLSSIETLEAESQQLEHAFYRTEQLSLL